MKTNGVTRLDRLSCSLISREKPSGYHRFIGLSSLNAKNRVSGLGLENKRGIMGPKNSSSNKGCILRSKEWCGNVYEKKNLEREE